MKKFSFKFLIMFSMITTLLIASSISPIDRINESALASVSQELDTIIDNAQKFEDTYSDVSLEELNLMKEDLTDLLKNNKVLLNTDGELDFNNVSGKVSEDHALIYLPILYENANKNLNKSFFTVGFKNGKVDFYYEVKLLGNEHDYSSETAMYSNGILVNEQTLQFTEEDFIMESQQDSSAQTNSPFSLLEPQVAKAGWWGNFNDCLASKGIAAWAITSLSIVCGFACIGTVGAGCVPCLLGAGLLTEGVIAYCIGMAGAK